MNTSDEAHPLSRRDFLRWTAAGALLSLGVGASGTVAASKLEVERRELRLPRWDADGFKVAVISDIHVNEPVAAARAETAVDMALAENPDLIALPGDFLNYFKPYTMQTMTKAIERLNDAHCPVIGTLGNHDYDAGDVPGLLRSLKSTTPIRMLVNESVDVQGVTIAGIDDALNGSPKPAIVKDLSNKSLLVFYHEPDYVIDVPRNAGLQISGHSHGGQICLPGGIPLIHRPGARQYMQGYFPDANVPLYVTRGVGTVGPTIRTFCPPEVSILTLRSQP